MYLQPGPRVHLLLDALAFLPTHLVVLPLTAALHAVRYWLAPSARLPRLGWWRYIVLNVQRVRAQCIRGICVNYADPNAARRIPSKYDGVCDVAALTVPPADVPRLDVLAIDAVKERVVAPAAVPGFWVAAKGRNLDAPAKPDERVIYFIVGGGYAHGHPLDPHTAFSFALLTGARVFCTSR
jgi:acetyl esterase/lipase